MQDDLCCKIQNYLKSAKEQLEIGHKTLAAFYYGNANAIYDFLSNFHNEYLVLIDATCGNDFIFLDHELFPDVDF